MKPRLIFAFLFLVSAPAMAENGKVVVTIKPLHSLVAGVMQESGMSPALLVDGKGSLHEFSLRPSQASMLRHADIVFYMGDDFELFGQRILPQLPSSTKRVPMEHAKNMTLYPLRFFPHNHPNSAHDLHAWMSPANARAMVAEIARILSATYPDKAALFSHNAATLDQKLAALDNEVGVRMAKLTGKPYAVFHDASQYFDRHYHLNNIGSLTLHPEHAPSAKRMQELRARIVEMKVMCVFREPQFDRRIVDNLMKNTGAKSAMLDPEASLLAPGPDLYFQLIENTAASLEGCLSA